MRTTIFVSTCKVYFTMFLDACNTSSEIDVECKDNYFTKRSFNDYPGEKISDIDTTTLRHIKVMRRVM